jgi:autophagy-related protein 13
MVALGPSVIKRGRPWIGNVWRYVTGFIPNKICYLFCLTKFLLQSASFLSANTEDDDISAFVQDIDARKPLTGLRRTQDNAGSPRLSPEKEGQDKPGQNHEREPTLRPPRETSPRDPASVPSSSSAQPDLGTSRGGAMLTSETEVDARLKEMNETFLASLRDLSSGSTRRKTSSQDVPSLLPPSPGPAAAPRSPLSDRRGAPAQEGGGSPFASRPASVAPSIVGQSGLSQASDEVLGKMSFEAPRSRKL